MYYRLRTENLGTALVGLVLQAVFMPVGMASASWIIPGGVALIHGGWSELVNMPRQERFFPGTLPWMDPTSAELLAAVKLICALSGFVGGVWIAVQCWRWLVVRVLRLMTMEEFEEHMRSYPDF